MNNKKNILSLIGSIFSLCLAIVLSIVIVYAWFGNNAVTTSSINVSVIGGSEITVKLEGYDSANNKWVDVSNINFENIHPGDKYYLRLNITSRATSNTTITANYGEYDSDVSDLISATIDPAEIATGDIKGHITYAGINIMDIYENPDSETNEVNPYIVKMDNEIIYYISTEGEITVVEKFKIHNAMVSYNLGSSQVDSKPSDLSFEGIIPTDLSKGIFGNGATVYANSTTYCYFALEYTNYESDSIEEKKYNSNNYFVYQTFKVSEIKVFGA